ncbi:MAG: hypothetical protein FJ271_27340 [Planctomycetes bacterium]|nr:hypothetical protein [Planctomycetota bacterium]
MAQHDDSADDAFTSFSELHGPAPRVTGGALPLSQPSGADAEAFKFTSTHDSIRQTAENAIAYQTGRGRRLLFVLGGAQLGFMWLFTVTLADEFRRRNDLVLMTWFLGIMIGSLFIGLGFWSRRDPLLASVIALSVYLAANVTDLVLFFGLGIMLLPGGWLWFWVIRAVLVAFLIDSVRAALAYKRIVNKMIEEMRRETAR